MGNITVDDVPHWYVVHTNPNQENRVELNLRAWNVETFSPKLKERRHNPFTSKVSYIARPLFPSYLFARFGAHSLLHKVNFTRGVQSVVSFGGQPCTVDDEIVKLIESRRDADGFVRVGEELTAGSKVVICSGPLRNIVGILEGNYRDSERVALLLTAVGYQSRVLVGRDVLQKVGEDGVEGKW